MSETESTQFDTDMTIAEALNAHPRAREVFAAYQLGGCALCAMSQTETLSQLCDTYGIDAQELLEALEAVAKTPAGKGK